MGFAGLQGRSRHPRVGPTPLALARGGDSTSTRLVWPSPLPSVALSAVKRMTCEGPMSRGYRRARARRYRTLLTLAPPLPASPVQSTRSPDRICLSWDFQRSPLRRIQPESPLPAPQSPKGAAPSGASSQLAPRSVLVVFHHPDGFLLPNPARMLQRASGHGVHVVSDVHSCPPKPFPRWKPGSRHWSVPSLARPDHRSPCPPALFRRVCTRRRDLKALLLQSGPLP